jgi:hypothetical protein
VPEGSKILFNQRMRVKLEEQIKSFFSVGFCVLREVAPLDALVKLVELLNDDELAIGFRKIVKQEGLGVVPRLERLHAAELGCQCHGRFLKKQVCPVLEALQ